MDSQGGLVVWILGGAGVLFMYAAYSKQHPAAVLGKTLGSSAGPATLGPRESSEAYPIEPKPAGKLGTVTRAGTSYIVDGVGNPVGVVPAPYQSNSKSYIPNGAVLV